MEESGTKHADFAAAIGISSFSSTFDTSHSLTINRLYWQFDTNDHATAPAMTKAGDTEIESVVAVANDCILAACA